MVRHDLSGVHQPAGLHWAAHLPGNTRHHGPIRVQRRQNMKRALHFAVPAVLLCATAGLLAQNPIQPAADYPAGDTAYKSSFVPELPVVGPDMKVEDDARARREW